MNLLVTTRIITLLAQTAIVLSLASQTAVADNFAVERLTWAGVKIVSGDTTVFIDAVGKDLWEGNAPEGLVPVTADTARQYALITHTHNDHFDAETLGQVLGPRGYVICHESVATYVASRGLQVIPAKHYEPILRGGFVFTAVPAEDGFGDQQVSWIVSKDGRRVLHGGDTLWHGMWSTIGKQYGPFDAVFMPINGAQMAGEPATESPRVQTPLQAIDAAALLGARILVPIHYGLNDPPHYTEVEDPLGTLRQHASRRGQVIQHLLPGQSMTWAD